ncbi:MAG: hypothetical protein KDI88_06750 [Gammaproteobacteria bacterium]|nr:hypothetical protein [Gammaproteobacteria bacterium]
MIKAFSQRLTPPFSGLVQIAESERARALTMDGNLWEIHFRHAGNDRGGSGPPSQQHSFRRVAYVRHSEMSRISEQGTHDGREIDERILELTSFLTDAELPFPTADEYEYWLLDPRDESPLALIFTCTEADDMPAFPVRPEWTALPAAVMPVEATDEEKDFSSAPVNYRVERLVAERAGSKPRARWFRRRPTETDTFPAMLLREDWDDPADHDLCQRYLMRQSTRLLMLPALEHDDRLRLEQASRSHVMEVARFFSMYPQVIDNALMSTIRVEARMRGLDGSQDRMQNRRDGVLYL